MFSQFFQFSISVPHPLITKQKDIDAAQRSSIWKKPKIQNAIARLILSYEISARDRPPFNLNVKNEKRNVVRAVRWMVAFNVHSGISSSYSLWGWSLLEFHVRLGLRLQAWTSIVPGSDSEIRTHKHNAAKQPILLVISE
jgi:hypothetical protein